ncbi:MAG: carboxy terminal-processing peptidase [Planctomycetia bacterium]|nr:carboxy terminal-processing peptidase [Planctomycetia bacterium]
MLVGGRAWGEISKPGDEDHNVTLAVAQLLRTQHISKHPLDNEISHRFLERFLKTLDPMKLYFEQSDVDAFKKSQLDLDDAARRGDVRFAYDVFNVFLHRVDERIKMVDELLKMDHDFTVDEEMVIDPEAATYAKGPSEARDLWRKRIKYDLLLQKTAKPKKSAEAKNGEGEPEPKKTADKPEDPREKLSKRYHNFARRMHQIDNDELLEMYLTALTTSFDPHTSYMSPRTLENFEIEMRLQLDGIGAALMSGDDGYTVVSKIVPGGAADKDGRLKAEDRVTGVGQGAGGPIEDVVNMKLSDVVQKIRGRRGTVVRLEVMPIDTTERKIYDITRDEIKLTDQEARGRIIEQTKGGTTYRIGAIDLPSFYMDMEGARRDLPDFKSTTRDVRRILDDFKSKGVQAVVLDLRNNGGGSLTEAISLTGLFIDEGPVVQVKDSEGRVQQYDDIERGAAWDGPLVVLTNKLSASASEIFAGAIQDYKRGLVVGDHATHGKGTVQSLLDLSRQLLGRIPNAPQLGALKITMQKFYRPDGDSTQNRGVVADIELPWLTSELPVGESDLDYALSFDRVNEAPYRKLQLVDRQLTDQLNTLSAERRKESSEFQAVERRIVRYQEQKNRKSVTLNEKKFLAEREEVNADKEEEREFEELANRTKPVFDPNNFYNREVLAITVDYLQLTKLARAR